MEAMLHLFLSHFEVGGGGGGAGAVGANGVSSASALQVLQQRLDGGAGSSNIIFDSPTVGTPGPVPGRYLCWWWRWIGAE
jgi:hypothetical protein